MTPRKLSLEERITLSNLTKHPIFTGSRDNQIIRTVADYEQNNYQLNITKDRTVDALMCQLDEEGIPDTTNCPYPFYFITEYVVSAKRRLDLVRITHDRKLQFTSVEMREKTLEMALEGELKRAWRKIRPDQEELVYTLCEHGEPEIDLKEGDMLVVQPAKRDVYACWVDPAKRAKPPVLC